MSFGNTFVSSQSIHRSMSPLYILAGGTTFSSKARCAILPGCVRTEKAHAHERSSDSLSIPGSTAYLTASLATWILVRALYQTPLISAAYIWIGLTIASMMLLILARRCVCLSWARMSGAMKRTGRSHVWWLLGSI